VVWYLDTSALLKLVIAEEHSKAMRAWVGRHPEVVSNDLLRTEAIRTARRISTEAVAAGRVALEVSTSA
jgi:hypothetical protein